MDRPSDNVSMGMIVGLLLVVVVLLVVLTLAIMWLKKNYSGGTEAAENEKTDDRQLLADLGKLKSELSPDVFKAFQRTIVTRDPGMMAMIGPALQVALERGGAHPGFGNMLLTLGISGAGGYGEAFLIGALEIYEQKFGPTHAETATTLAVVARTLAKQKSRRAGEFLQRAVQLYESALPDHSELPKLRTAYEAFVQQS